MKHRLFFLFLMLSGCVTPSSYKRDVLNAYKKGLKVGVVIGRDNVLSELRSPDCFMQHVDELINDDPAFQRLAEQTARDTDQLLKSKRIRP